VTKAREINPFLGEASRHLAFLYSRKGNLKKAREILENACAASPLDEENDRYLAEICYQLGDRKEAMYKLRRVISLNPHHRWAWQSLWEWATEEQEPGFFMEVAEKIRDQREGDPVVWVYLAESYFHGGETEKGLQALDKAFLLDPQSVSARDLKARYLAANGKYIQALAACQLRETETIPPELLIRKAVINIELGHKVEAAGILKQVLAEAPELEYSWSLLLYCLDDLKDTRGLEEYAKKMIHLFPLNPVPYEYLGSIYMEQKEHTKARHVLTKAWFFSPSNSYSGTRLFSLELQHGNIEQAKKIMESLGIHLGLKNVYYQACKAPCLAQGPLAGLL
jgi:tetratricopeptide (TPR) repeat protein